MPSFNLGIQSLFVQISFTIFSSRMMVLQTLWKCSSIAKQKLFNEYNNGVYLFQTVIVVKGKLLNIFAISTYLFSLWTRSWGIMPFPKVASVRSGGLIVFLISFYWNCNLSDNFFLKGLKQLFPFSLNFSNNLLNLPFMW